MKLPLQVGLPLLGLLLLGLAFTEGRDQMMLIVLAMGVALWSAFSLPHPPPREPEPSLLEGAADETEDDVPGANGSGTQPGTNGGGPGDTDRSA